MLKKIDYSESTVIFCDNSSTVMLARNLVMHGRSKHIDVRYYFLRELVNDEVVQLQFCGTRQQIADIFTKMFKFELFRELRRRLGVCELPHVN